MATAIIGLTEHELAERLRVYALGEARHDDGPATVWWPFTDRRHQ
jgi:hypothetical protein